MPRIPTTQELGTPSISARSPGEVSRPFRALGALGQTAIKGITEVREQEQTIERELTLASKNSELEQGLTELQIEAKKILDSEEADAFMAEGSRALAEGLAADIDDPVSLAAFQVDALNAVVRSRGSLTNFLAERDGMERVASLDRDGVRVADLIDRAGSADEAEALRDAHIRNIDASADMTPLEKETKIQAFDRGLDMTAAKRDMIANPTAFSRNVESREIYPHLEPDDRILLARAALTEFERQNAERRRRIADDERTAQQEWGERIINPDPANGVFFPTEDEIFADDRLSGPQQEHYAALQKSVIRGDDLNKPNHRINAQLLERILDDTRKDHIFDERQLTPYLRHTDHGTLMRYRSIIRENANNELKPANIARRSFLKNVADQITGANPVQGIPDPLGDEHLHAFNMLFLQRWEQKRAAGENPAELTDPTHKDYMGGATVKAFIPTVQDRFDAQLQSMEILDQGVSDDRKAAMEKAQEDAAVEQEIIDAARPGTLSARSRARAKERIAREKAEAEAFIPQRDRSQSSLSARLKQAQETPEDAGGEPDVPEKTATQTLKEAARLRRIADREEARAKERQPRPEVDVDADLEAAENPKLRRPGESFADYLKRRELDTGLGGS